MSMKDPLHFPSYSSLPFQPSITNEPTTEPLQHYCFLAQITEISFVNRPRVTIDIGNAETAIIESNSRSSPTTFAWTDLKPGNTIAILYATRQPLSDGTIGIRADDLNRVMIFRSGISNLTCYADKLMATPTGSAGWKRINPPIPSFDSRPSKTQPGAQGKYPQGYHQLCHARSLKFLRVNNLIGTIPGTIPSELWTLKTLKHLDLCNGNLTGPLHLSSEYYDAFEL
ncbi:hypothetical protein BCR33DRAFT_852159 [Rhizoclosmatium globosum]|uniref:L domain-like protein n=1 Tax=Rhizoclosmatium globosum TaxID=329046 RepID=A0A1Y2C5S6_9FUNG|nr:hypothetical protein BCR33DRAFT_852159 [Rhizoclosmatium globosum]|eukprot:ORY41655.1 hypothetical protein BCR33DRAFT_852159 [Rhizoclosmatium globosum]